MTEKSSFSDSAEKLALNVSLTSLILNVLLSICKLSAGIAGHSQAMIPMPFILHPIAQALSS